MAETFYSVLGVESGADGEAVEQAYRERVKESHPDVTDDPDDPGEFARLTVARDVLVDDEERGCYDRLGHAAYVRAHVDASAWTTEESGTDADTSGTGGGRGSATTGTDTAAEGTDATATSPEDRAGQQGGDGTVAGEEHDRGASARADTAGASVSAGAATGREQQHRRQRGTAAPYHRIDPTDIAGREHDPLWRRAVAAGRRVGPWALVHLVLVASAAATVWFGYAAAAQLDMSLPALAVAVVVLVTTLLASAAHLLSRVYA